MNARQLRELMVFGTTAMFAAAGIVRYRHAAAELSPPRVEVVTRAPDVWLETVPARADSIAEALDRLAEHDPFARASAESAAAAPVSPAPVVLRAPRPTFVLRGIVGTAPNWRAVLDGLPGVESGGALLAAGDSVGGFRVRRVTADSVTIQGADTTWRLGVRGNP